MEQNLPLPYQVNRNSAGLYYFATTDGIIYFCKFADKTLMLSPMLGIYDIEIYEFEFFPFIPDGIEKRIYDDRVAITILNVIQQVFTSSLRVLIYLCDASDNKQKARQKLFGSWHKKMLSSFVRRIPVELEMLQDDNSIHQVLGSILIRNDFPHFDVLQRELIDQAVGIISEKYDL